MVSPLLLALLAMTAQPGPAGSPPPGTADAAFDNAAMQLDGLFSRTASSGGAFLMRFQIGDRNVTRAYGALDCAGTMPARADALFDGGSLTKLFTAAAILKLIEQHRLGFDDRLGVLFRDVPADKADITVAQLLTHRSGIPNFIGDDGAPLPARNWSIDGYDYAPRSRSEMLRLAWAAPLDFPPGTQEAYSNSGFNILAAVIEQASGQSYETYVRDAVLSPLGMASTGYVLLDRQRRPIAEQCRDGRAAGDPLTRGVWRDGVSWNLLGAGGMMTSLDDLGRWSDGIAVGMLFRPDIAARFRALFYGPSYRCGTEGTAVGGSNGMTRSLIMHYPARRESVISVALHREHNLPEEGDMRAILCPGR